MNNKRDRFVKVASYRTNQALKYIRLISNCSNRNNYDYSDAEVNKQLKQLIEDIQKNLSYDKDASKALIEFIQEKTK
jgi:hypothetical protein